MKCENLIRRHENKQKISVVHNAEIHVKRGGQHQYIFILTFGAAYIIHRYIFMHSLAITSGILTEYKGSLS